MRLVWDNFRADPTRKLVLLRLADYGDDAGGSIFPSVATVASSCGISESQARRHLHELMRAGYVRVIGNEKGGRNLTRQYRIVLDRLKGCADETLSPDQKGCMDAQKPSHGCAENPCTHDTRVVRGTTKKRERGRKPALHALPNDFSLTPETIEWCQQQRYTQKAVQKTLEHMTTWAKSKGPLRADWQETFKRALEKNWADLDRHDRYGIVCT